MPPPPNARTIRSGDHARAGAKRGPPQAFHPLVRGLLQQLVARALGDLPEQVPHVDRARVGGDADRAEVLIHAAEQLRVAREREVRLAEVQRANVADRQQGVCAGRLCVGEDPRVQVQVVVRLRLVDVAGAAAGDRFQLLELETDLRRERTRGRVQFLRGERCEAALVVRDLLHCFGSASSSGSHGCGKSLTCSTCSSCWWWSLDRPRSIWTMPSAPSRPCVWSRSCSARDSLTSAATCGGNRGGTLPLAASDMANFICLIEVTMPWVFGTSSVSRSQPVVFAEVTNHFACFAPMSRSISSL